MNRPPQPLVRSLLYVPGNKLDWMLKAPKYDADALIFDLEDSVPPDQKAASRKLVRQAIDELGSLGRPRLFVRVNGFSTGLAKDDLEAVVAPGLFGVQAPKIEGPEAVQQLDAVMSRLEQRAGLSPGQVFLMPLIETANGVRQAYEIAMAAARVAYLMGAAGGGIGDMALSVGYRPKTGWETAYIFGKIVVDARSAGVEYPCTGITSAPIHDLDAVRRIAEKARDFGYRGVNLIHPSHVPIANEVFGMSGTELTYWQGLVDAVEEGERRGTSAVVYDGRMVDIAHLNHAREMLRQGAELGL